MSPAPAIRFGTCSWKYDSWRGILYPEQPTFDHLAEYARSLDTVEIDQWFWSLFGQEKIALPRRDNAQHYHDVVPATFRFTVKAPNSITLTHFYRRAKTESLHANPHFLSRDLYQRFCERIAPLQSKLGLLMFQFEYLSRDKMESPARFRDMLADFLRALPRTWPLGMEMRNPNYLDGQFFDLLRELDVAPVLIQGYYMPPLWEVYEKHADRCSDLVALRLMGPDRGSIEEAAGGKWDRLIEPKDGELARILNVIRDIRKRGKSGYVNVNNHYEGSAPLTIRKLQAGLG
jgi:uncharacterized protein YecE (DUF72 family)